MVMHHIMRGRIFGSRPLLAEPFVHGDLRSTLFAQRAEKDPESLSSESIEIEVLINTSTRRLDRDS